MENQQPSSSMKSSARRLALAIALALGAQACAHKGQAPEAKAQPQEAGKPVAAAAAKPVPPPPPIIDQQALDRLKAMSETLAASQSFTYRSRSTIEQAAVTGQFVTRFLESQVALQRPNKLHVSVTGDTPNFHFFYDGVNATAFDATKKLYATAKAPETIDLMLPFVQELAGIDFPAADLMVSNPYAEMTKGLTHAIVIGTSQVNGVATDHFAFMNTAANWEIWIDKAPSALPRRIAVTYKTVENFPRFLVEFFDWNLNAKKDPRQFVFNKPAGAKPIEFGNKAGASR